MKYEEVYLKAYQGGTDARVGLGNYFRFYNTERPPSSRLSDTGRGVYLNPGGSYQ